MSSYSDIVRDHFANPRNVGEIAGVPFGQAGKPGEGPHMRLWLRVVDDVVAEVRYKTYGCPASIASGSALTEMVEGQSVEACGAISAGGLLAALGGLPLGKRHCAQLAISALRDALARATAPAASALSAD